jgi:hypothetical protein
VYQPHLSQVEEEFILDYPNLEVRQSLVRHLLASYFETPIKADETCKRIQKALSNRDPEALVEEFNMLMSRIPYDYHQEKRDEFFLLLGHIYRFVRHRSGSTC